MSPINSINVSRIFSKLDKNGDGLVSLDELKGFLETIGINSSQEELELLVGKTSLDSIDFFFFYDAITKANIKESNKHDHRENIFLEHDLLKVFRVFDTNGDGFICCEELQRTLSRLGLWDEKCGKDCKSMINVYDKNSDGKLDFEEFKDMMFAN
ncbi:probable calcium-binding protein CML44 [Lycium barbarum]|uniref:probable calcium-binding protein CML44 n=1 Tax=Lycium ferocissimum TaxID=112874 RepID=UPI002814D829|nr:probable calcium-binding protein CML44 [Lycium ferocissimum]XP_060192734.1 probable calcium-binding protein CML44 [Lycium barbarum]